MSATFAREELELAALLLVVDEAGGYKWSASGHGQAAVASQLRRIANDLMLQTIETTGEPGIQAALISSWEDDTQADLAELVGTVVASLRDRHVSFAVIGKAFGVSRQAAWERFTNLLSRRKAAGDA